MDPTPVSVSDTKQKPSLAELREKRQQSPSDPEICFELAVALEEDGQDPASALAYYRETERLDPGGLGVEAKVAAAKLQQRWLQVSLEDAEEQLLAKAHKRARRLFEDTLELAEGQPKAYPRARRGFYQASCGELLQSLKAKQSVVFSPLLGVQSDSDLSFAKELEQWLYAELNQKKAKVLKPTDKSQAQFEIRGALGQRVTLQLADRQTGQVAAHLLVRRIPENAGDRPWHGPDLIDVRLRVEARRDRREGGSVNVPMFEEAILYSGDRLRFFVQVNQRAWIYIFLFDSQGQVNLLYPGTENYYPELKKAGVKTSNPARAQSELMIPPSSQVGKDFWFFLDENPGREKIVLAASILPLKSLEDLCAKIGDSDVNPADLSTQIYRELSKSLGKTRFNSASEPEVAGNPQELLTGRGAVVRSIQFIHRGL